MRLFFIIAGWFYMFFGGALAFAAEPTGVWITEGGRSIINIADCPPEGRDPRILCSKIIWLKEPFNKEGGLLRDERNKDRKLRKRPILGMPILLNLRQAQNNTWDGQVYNPEDGKVYRAQIIAQNRKTLTVKGCAKILFNWVCKTRTWQRAPQEILNSEMPLEPQISGDATKARAREQ